MLGYRRIHLPAHLHDQIKQLVEKSSDYRSVDQFCREAAETIIRENHLVHKTTSGRNKPQWKSANIPAEDYHKIRAWIQSGKAPYISVNDTLRSVIHTLFLKEEKKTFEKKGILTCLLLAYLPN